MSFDEPNLAWHPRPDEELQGLEIDLAKNLTRWIFGCSWEGIDSHLELVEVKSAHRSNFLIDHEVDAVISNYADTPDRRKDVTFAGHYLSTKFAPLLSPSSPEIVNLSDLSDLRVAVVAGTTGEDLFRNVAPHAECVPMDTVSECLDSLSTGKVEACWTTTAGNAAYTRTPDAGLTQGSFKHGGEYWAVGVNRDATDMAHCVNDMVANLLATGQLARLMRRWLPECS